MANFASFFFYQKNEAKSAIYQAVRVPETDPFSKKGAFLTFPEPLPLEGAPEKGQETHQKLPAWILLKPFWESKKARFSENRDFNRQKGDKSPF